MIDFEIAPLLRQGKKLISEYNRDTIWELARYYDEHEHEPIKETMEIREKNAEISVKLASIAKEEGIRGDGFGMTTVILGEERYKGDPAIYVTSSDAFVGNMVVGALGSPEQRAKAQGTFVAFAITEPGCGSDTSAIQTTARHDRETNEWVINGEKIFITGGSICSSCVVWATLDRSMGRAAMKSFLVYADNPGMKVAKLEDKLGFRASDTAALVFEDCRIPYGDILGSPEIKQKKVSDSGFKGVMKTFDMSRPFVASLSLGMGQAALDLTREKLEEEGYTFPYNKSLHELNSIQREFLEMEAGLDAARLLTWKAAAMIDMGLKNNLEASMAKAKAGRVSTLITERCVALLGPLGYSRDCLVEKFMRDCKVTDIFEGTGQINFLIIARNILGFSREELK